MSGSPDEKPNVARIYDYLLGGSHNLAVDRSTAKAIMSDWPDVVRAARANRGFLRHTVTHALDLGVRQFLDLGSGLPTAGSVHEVALARDPGARVAYVELDPVTVAHAERVLADLPGVTVTCADLRDHDAVLAAPGVAGLLDFTRPVALLALAALHFVADDEDPAGIVEAYRARFAPGSLLAMSHVSDDYPEHPEVVRDNQAAMAKVATTSTPSHPRSRAGIVALADGFGADVERLVDVSAWSTDRPEVPLAVYAMISDPLAD